MSRDDRNRWPVHPRTRQPLPPRAQPGYYPAFHTLAQQDFWDDATRRLIERRVHDLPPIRFFDAGEAALLQAVCDRILPQDDRDESHTIPIVNGIDARLFINRTDGYRYEHMPPDRDAHRLGLRGVEAIAQHLFGRPFIDLAPLDQDRVLETIHDAKPPAAQEIWNQMPVQRYWMLLVQDVLEVYYAHPWAWDEIGFGGPAYPRGYMRLERGEREPWEVDEQRYAWDPPESALSGHDRPIAGTTEHRATPGQGGTH
jgi:hypothetical protein